MSLKRRTSAFPKRPLLSFSSFLLATTIGLISSFTFSTTYDMARSALRHKPQTVSGVWQGEWQGIRAVTIKLEQQNDTVSGTVTFYRIVATEDGPKVEGQSEEIPIINARLEGKRLVFELGAIDEIHPRLFVEMEMSFEKEDEAILRCARLGLEDSAEDTETIIYMTREPSF